MTTLNRLGAALAFAYYFVFGAFQECGPTIASETNATPCIGTQLTPDDPSAPGETSTPPDTADVFTISLDAVDVLLGALSIF